jgi:hypothetical protein
LLQKGQSNRYAGNSIAGILTYDENVDAPFFSLWRNSNGIDDKKQRDDSNVTTCVRSVDSHWKIPNRHDQ